MNPTFAEKLKSYRLNKGASITDVANAIGKSRPYLSRIESGLVMPSPQVLELLIRYFNLDLEQSEQLAVLAGHRLNDSSQINTSYRGEVNLQMDGTQTANSAESKQPQINVDPKTVPVLYTDSVYVTSSPWGLVFDFAQGVGPTNQQNVVSRVGMSKEHARALIEIIKMHVEPNLQNVKMHGDKN